LVDAAGRTLRLPEPARRVVSLVPSATQTLRALGAEDRLVGRTDFDTASWVRHVPTVGGGIGPDLETIVALQPDLVVRFAGDQDPRTPGLLDDLGIRHLAIRPDRVQDVLEATRMLGRSVGMIDRAELLVDSIRMGLEGVSARARAYPRRSVAYVLGGSPPWVAGPGTYIDELMTAVGGDNVFGDLTSLYAPVSPEELRAREIEVVLVSGTGVFDPKLTPGARVEVIDEGLEIPGPDLVASALRLAELIHGPLTPSP
jgi:ABC-type Fe3+-hydroxamate transport system substrate-binding protein